MNKPRKYESLYKILGWQPVRPRVLTRKGVRAAVTEKLTAIHSIVDQIFKAEF